MSPDTAGCPPRASDETASCCHHFIVTDRDLTCNHLPLDLSIFYLDSVFSALSQWWLDVQRLVQPLNNLYSFHFSIGLPTGKLQIKTWKTEIFNRVELLLVKDSQSSRYLQSHGRDLRDPHALCALRPQILSPFAVANL